MAEDTTDLEAQEQQQDRLEGGTYEIIRNRLVRSGRELSGRLQELNVERKKVFGSIETKPIYSARINTENNCIARDIVSIGNMCIFGYHVHIGLRTETFLQDVFSFYEFQGDSFKEIAIGDIEQEHPAFVNEFKNLYRYYRETTFVRFAVEPNSPFFYMVFQLSSSKTDIKLFQWEIRDSKLRYVNEPGQKRYNQPPQHEFEWKSVSREMQRMGEHPHYNILDRVFVETVGGDLTIKVEDNTADGKGIYSETVQHKGQKLSDASIEYSDLGNLIALKVRPYQEASRYFIFNEKQQKVQRIEALAQSGILLPSSQGLIFSNGFYLQTGDYKIFDSGTSNGYLYERRIPSPNGEDHLFVFYHPVTGAYLLLSYNVIEQTVLPPIHCNGFSLYEDGELCFFRSEDTPSKHHVVQIWQTPYLKGEFSANEHKDSFLFTVGNRDVVRAMAECNELLSLIGKGDAYSGLYFDLAKKAGDILDAYFWIKDPQAYSIKDYLEEIRTTANSAIDEFEKVQAIRKATREAIREAEKETEDLLQEIGQKAFNQVDTFVQSLAKLRILRGKIISLKELRYVDTELIEALEARITEENSRLSDDCVQFLLADEALNPYHVRVAEARSAIEEVSTAKQGKELEERIDAIGKELELLIEIVSNLKIEDPTQTTKIIDSITAIFSTLNQVKAAIRRRLRDLNSTEATAEFAAQAKLLDQAMINFLDMSDTPAKCDEYLTRLMVQLEEVESRFAEFDEFILKISEKREEIYNAFENRKVSLVESINRRAAALQTAAERILSGAKNRANAMKEVAEIHGFFASDMMIEKIREIIQQLEELGDSNKAGDIQTQLKTIREEAIRQLRDKQDLYSEGAGGGEVIQMGRHRFAVNRQNLDLTLVLRNGRMYYHLTGTNFFEEITDPDFLATKEVWEQNIISENRNLYRAEYLAYILFRKIKEENIELRSDELLEYLQGFSANRYQEGYSKGIHDEDATKILKKLLYVQERIDLLYYPSSDRALAHLCWSRFLTAEEKEYFNKQLKTAGIILQVFPESREFDFLLRRIEKRFAQFIETTELFLPRQIASASEYLFKELSRQDVFIVSQEAHQLKEGFLAFLEQRAALRMYNDSVQSLKENTIEQMQMARKWIQAFVDQYQGETPKEDLLLLVDEAAVWSILDEKYKQSQIVDVQVKAKIMGMHGNHNLVGEGGIYLFDFHRFMAKLNAYMAEIVPRFESFQEMKKNYVEQTRKSMRLEEFKPVVMSAFVRNKLIDTLYLHIIGDNLAKQMGTVGDSTRTDRMGMLLLISPPGYGKTTLMEYIANRLGLIFMKINGPAIGHKVTSLDPKEADNAASAMEIEKLNLALEMGDNIMIYLDDIQHCNPEFLQKFISLTDGQRKIEGTYKGLTKTYDLRGRRVCVCMAGNPYTESGDKFRIPDMLANRSDIYNLGDIIGDTKDVFELSYIENALTSNQVLQKLAAKSLKDVYTILRYIETGSQDGLEFEANHTPQELNEYAEVLKRMVRVRDILLKVNLQYIASAAVEEDYRMEPAFKLQGSYRNMSKLAEKLSPIMNDAELTTLLLAHYEGESQTLTTGAEANMLKLKEMMGVLTGEEQQRWNDILETFSKNKLLRGNEDNPVVQVVAQLSQFSDGLRDIRRTIADGLEAKREMAENTGTAPVPPRSSGGVKLRRK